MKTFRSFVVEQVSRVEALHTHGTYLYSESAQMEIRDWFENKSGEKAATTKQSVLQWLQESDGARKVKAVMDDVMEDKNAPTLSDIRAIWDRMFGTSKPVNYDCLLCGGSGFEQVVDTTGAEGAKRCRRGCVVPAPRYQAEKPNDSAASAASAANAALGAAFAQDVAMKFAKPVAVPVVPPPLTAPITEDDIRKADKRLA